MATLVPLEAPTIDALDHAVSSGRFASRDDAIRLTLKMYWESDAETAAAPLTAGELAAIDEGLADLRNGRTYSLDQVRAEMRQRFGPSA